MAEHHSSPEARDAYNQIWQTYYRFTPQNEQERIWYTQSLTRLNQLGDQRRLRMLSSRSGGVPSVMWGVVRRQSFWDSELVHLREALARLLGDVMRPADDAASVDW